MTYLETLKQKRDSLIAETKELRKKFNLLVTESGDGELIPEEDDAKPVDQDGIIAKETEDQKKNPEKSDASQSQDGKPENLKTIQDFLGEVEGEKNGQELNADPGLDNGANQDTKEIKPDSKQTTKNDADDKDSGDKMTPTGDMKSAEEFKQAADELAVNGPEFFSDKKNENESEEMTLEGEEPKDIPQIEDVMGAAGNPGVDQNTVDDGSQNAEQDVDANGNDLQGDISQDSQGQQQDGGDDVSAHDDQSNVGTDDNDSGNVSDDNVDSNDTQNNQDDQNVQQDGQEGSGNDSTNGSGQNVDDQQGDLSGVDDQTQGDASSDGQQNQDANNQDGSVTGDEQNNDTQNNQEQDADGVEQTNEGDQGSSADSSMDGAEKDKTSGNTTDVPVLKSGKDQFAGEIGGTDGKKNDGDEKKISKEQKLDKFMQAKISEADGLADDELGIETVDLPEAECCDEDECMTEDQRLAESMKNIDMFVKANKRLFMENN